MIGIFGLIFIIVAPFLVYRTAKQNGRNAIGWALTAFAVGFGIQIIIPLGIGIVLGAVWMLSGSTEAEVQRELQTPAIIIGIICLILSVVGVMIVMRIVNKIPEEQSFVSPPSPPKFD